MTSFHVARYVRESNLIENVDDPIADLVAEAAWYWLAEKEMLTVRTVLDLHAILMTPHQDSLDMPGEDWVGCWRRVDVRVGSYVAPPWQEVGDRMYSWVTIANRVIAGRNQSTTSPSPRDLHVLFEQVHPFADGNGRVGRHLMWWHEFRNGLRPTLLENERRHEYYRWFAVG